LLLSVVSEGVCFILNALSFMAVIAALAAMKMPHLTAKPRKEKILLGLKEGFEYGFGFKPIRYLLMNLALLSLAGMPYTVLMPVFARDVLAGGPHTLGFLVAMSGVGALISAVYLASRKSVIGLGKLVALAGFIFGSSLFLFSLSRYVSLSLLLSLCTGFGFMSVITSTNTILQTISPEDKRGRVMSLYTMAFMGMTPFGSLIIGALANNVGAPRAVTIGGIICILSSYLFFSRLPVFRSLIRPIYIEKGILSELQ